MWILGLPEAIWGTGDYPPAAGGVFRGRIEPRRGRCRWECGADRRFQAGINPESVRKMINREAQRVGCAYPRHKPAYPHSLFDRIAGSYPMGGRPSSHQTTAAIHQAASPPQMRRLTARPQTSYQQVIGRNRVREGEAHATILLMRSSILECRRDFLDLAVDCLLTSSDGVGYIAPRSGMVRA